MIHDESNNNVNSSFLLNVYIYVDQTFQNYLQRSFDYFCSYFGTNQLVIDVAGGMCLSMTVFWLLGLCYILIDLTRCPKMLYKYKTQQNNNNNNNVSFW